MVVRRRVGLSILLLRSKAWGLSHLPPSWKIDLQSSQVLYTSRYTLLSTAPLTSRYTRVQATLPQEIHKAAATVTVERDFGYYHIKKKEYS